MKGIELVIKGLHLNYGEQEVLAGIDLRIERGEALGLIGESGSGKSTLAYCIVRYLSRSAKISHGSVLLNGENILHASPERLRSIRSRVVSMIYQDPTAALNPTLTLGQQLLESIRQAEDSGDTQGRARALLHQVGLAHPQAMLRRFPHQVSGGEKQRVMIAMALATKPQLLICDEPTTALDATTAAQVLDLLHDLRTQIGASILYISHDLATVAALVDRAAVMRGGRILETGRVADILHAPQHTYTRQLLESAVPVRQASVHHSHHSTLSTSALLEVQGLQVSYGRDRLLDRWFKHRAPHVRAVSGIDLHVLPGETVGLVGESGCGKSTLAKTLAGLIAFDGRLTLAGRNHSATSSLDRSYRSDVQIIFQHPDAALNPRKTVGRVLARAAQLRERLRGTALDTRIVELLDMVRLPAHYAHRYPHELSGGEKQRVCIARALAPRPCLLICDEITSALDVSVQGSILNLLRDLQRQNGISILFISHDLHVVRHMAERIYVMYFGRIVEVRVAHHIDPPYHPYTEALFSAMPMPASSAPTRRIRLSVPAPDFANPVGGCSLSARCPRRYGDICQTEQPVLASVASHQIACHIPADQLLAVAPLWSPNHAPLEISHDRL